jgi:8-oxo-dGTP pyrophosphatase MutT (NUDIX family)
MSWKIKNTKKIYKDNYMTLERDSVITNYGDEVNCSIVRKEPFALVIPWDGSKFIIERLYRFAVNEFSWEFPAGHLQGGSVEQTAINELKEETGIKANKLVEIGIFHPANGFLDQACHVFLVTDLTFGETSREASEKGMIIKKVAPEEFEKMIQTGKIKDGPTISAYMLLRLNKYWKDISV